MKNSHVRRTRGKRRSGLSLAVLMSTKLDVPQSGKVGTTVNVKTRYGQIERQYFIPKDPKMPAQMRIRSNLGRIAPRWRVLEQEQRNAWTLAGQDADTRHRLGRAVPLTGFQFFLKINCSRAALGLEQFVTPPPQPQLGTNPVGDLVATNDGGVIALKLKVSSAPVQYTVVCGAAPCSAGRSSTRHFNILGFLPAPTRGVSDITDLYVARYGPIPAGSRIFIRTYLHIDGWEDLPKQTSVIVPKA
jgi:hypothetical protein